jgi:hypothetical protein
LRKRSFAQGPPAGELKSHVEGGVSYILGSSRGLDCVYTPAGVIPEYYRGSISKIGIDLGFNPAA